MEPFAFESWIYAVVGALVILGRTFLVWRARTFRGFAADDFLMIAALPLSAGGTIVGYIVETHTHGVANSGLTPEQRDALDPNGDEWSLRVEGSKAHLSGWMLYTALLWTLKLCCLFYYKRLGDRVDHMKLKINVGFALCAVTYLGICLSVLGGCWPFENHWQINPDPGSMLLSRFSTLTYAWVVVCTDVVTDLYIMAIPLPMIWRARISTTARIGLAAIFCGGLITIVFGILRFYFILENDPLVPDAAARWSDRETVVATVISNVPVIFPLLRQTIRSIKNSTSRGYKRTGNDSGGSSSTRGTFELSKLSHKGSAPTNQRLSRVALYGNPESQEAIIRCEEGGAVPQDVYTGKERNFHLQQRLDVG
ncbi:putative short-chain dehydrogenase reductase sdr protein [Hirsutella rhossiliensis]|uniref:Short-chain dehydrogenase reductase sdr protein n=1 Tax=Hirsutella rhossiliensis TaxID=111463 RepID=A0A9P8N0Y6_9HYPO|nr:putative short-chain dehydrogenase reductase sdr protein [Hirsutella rhossiliensis]KAH0964845.1 putative short-chain dehydrogenase reductase sdr protein [Hirsutella rhossiliensis]